MDYRCFRCFKLWIILAVLKEVTLDCSKSLPVYMKHSSTAIFGDCNEGDCRNIESGCRAEKGSNDEENEAYFLKCIKVRPHGSTLMYLSYVGLQDVRKDKYEWNSSYSLLGSQVFQVIPFFLPSTHNLYIDFPLSFKLSFPVVKLQRQILKKIFNGVVKTATEVRSLKRSKIGSTLHWSK